MAYFDTRYAFLAQTGFQAILFPGRRGVRESWLQEEAGESVRLPVDASEDLIVIGGSYIALKLAQMYRRFGSEVMVVEMAPRLI